MDGKPDAIFILIESQWNLNCGRFRNGSRGLRILIESQWNLNLCRLLLSVPHLPILIESQWNLNKGSGE